MCMQILVDLPESQVEAVLQCAKERGVSSSEVIREAILKEVAKDQRSPADFIGALKDDTSFGDGLEYQDRLRSEW